MIWSIENRKGQDHLVVKYWSTNDLIRDQIIPLEFDINGKGIISGMVGDKLVTFQISIVPVPGGSIEDQLMFYKDGDCFDMVHHNKFQSRTHIKETILNVLFEHGYVDRQPIIVAKRKQFGVASDHAGCRYKNLILSYLQDKHYNITDYGTFTEDSCDYPDFAKPLVEDILIKKIDVGFTVCTTGNGMNMVANRHKNIRSAICWNVETAHLARAHNNANVCSIPAKFVNIDELYTIINTFLNTEFEGGRHLNRINKF